MPTSPFTDVWHFLTATTNDYLHQGNWRYRRPESAAACRFGRPMRANPHRRGDGNEASRGPDQRWNGWPKGGGSRLGEVEAPLEVIENRFPTLFESRHGELAAAMLGATSMSLIGTFETWRPALTMSVSRGRPEVAGRWPK
jgi:hypothetical protein